MWRCNVCQAVSKQGQALRKHLLRRKDGSIAQELQICVTCGDLLVAGTPLHLVHKLRGQPEPGTVAPVAVEPVPEEPPAAVALSGKVVTKSRL